MRGEEGVGQPPGAGHDGWGGGEKEEGVEGLEDGGIGVEDEEARVLGLLEGEEFGVAVCPVGAGIYERPTVLVIPNLKIRELDETYKPPYFHAAP